MKQSRTVAVLGATGFVASVVASNSLTSRYGLVGGFVSAGTFTAGIALAVREVVRESAGRRWRTWVYLCIAIGTVASAAMTYTSGTFPGGPAPLRLALASGVAFSLSEIADHLVYEPLRDRGRNRAAAWSNTVGAVVDSALFLVIAGFPFWPAVASQVGVKWAIVSLPLALVEVARAVLRHRIRAEGA